MAGAAPGVTGVIAPGAPHQNGSASLVAAAEVARDCGTPAAAAAGAGVIETPMFAPLMMVTAFRKSGVVSGGIGTTTTPDEPHTIVKIRS